MSDIIWNFMDIVIDFMKKIMPDKEVFYHLKERIKVNLFSAKDPSDDDDPFFVVSNVDDSLGLLYSKCR